jgi:hypothetical protein
MSITTPAKRTAEYPFMSGLQKLATGAIAIIAVIALGTWVNGGRSVAPQDRIKMPTLKDVSADRWQELAARPIYFGHQSVGADIIAGVRDVLAANPQIRLNIVHADNPAPVSGPALVESLVGENGDTKSKAAAFQRAVDNGIGNAGGIAMYKYCFVDFQPWTDPQKLFDEYRATVEAVRAKYPRLVIVHITAPLTTIEPLWKFATKTLLRRVTARDLNIKRNTFNDRLRKEYRGKDPIFDLAEIESTRPDGSRSFFMENGVPVYALAPEYTSDGGHLNAIGRRAAAEQWLITLATLDDKRTVAAGQSSR